MTKPNSPWFRFQFRSGNVLLATLLFACFVANVAWILRYAPSFSFPPFEALLLPAIFLGAAGGSLFHGAKGILRGVRFGWLGFVYFVVLPCVLSILAVLLLAIIDHL